MWDFGDGDMSEDWSPEHVYSEGGFFLVTLIIEGFCTRDTMTQEIHISGTSVDDLTGSLPLSVFPNPNHGTFEVQVQLGPEAEVRVFDQLGRDVEFERKGRVLILGTRISGLYYMTVQVMNERYVSLLMLQY